MSNMTDDLVAASEALAVWDTRENYFALPKEDRDAFCSWLRRQGAESNRTIRVEVHLMDCLYAEVTYVKLNARGYAYLDENGDFPATERYTIVLTEPPPGLEAWEENHPHDR